MRISKIVKERDAAFIDAILYDKWDKVRKYAKKYDVPIPSNSKVMKVGVYKAVQHCTSIPEKIKNIAMEKCLKLGFSPFLQPDMVPEE